MRLLVARFVVGLASTFLATTLYASTISFSGNLRSDANVTSCGAGCTLGPSDSDTTYAQFAAVVENITVTQTSTLQAISFSYGGGVNAQGTTIAEGGLEPYLSLFDGAGGFLASTYLGTTCPAGANTNSVSGQCYDVLLDGGVLAAGSYEIALSAYANMSYAENLSSGTLADGFTGLGNLAPGEDLNYAFDVTLTPTTMTPTPEPLPLGLVGFSGVAGVVTRVLQWRRASRGALRSS